LQPIPHAATLLTLVGAAVEVETGAKVVVTVVEVDGVVTISPPSASTLGVGLVDTVIGATVRVVGSTMLGLPVVPIGAG